MQAKDISKADVVVVGAGNAALCAAMAAHEAGAKVVVLERAPQSEAGGNSQFEAGANVTFSGFTYSSASGTGELQTGQSASSGSTPSSTHTLPAGSTSTGRQNKIQ